MNNYRLRVIFIGHHTRDFFQKKKEYREAFAGPDLALKVRSMRGGPETVGEGAG